MTNQFETVLQLTSGELSDIDRLRRLTEFSHELGWRPADRIDVPATRDFTAAHLLVEHGLEHTAVLSFLRRPHQYIDLPTDDKMRLASIAYNNLVDWHVAIESDAITFIFVRTRVPTVVDRQRVSRENYERLRREAFEQVIGRRPNPNVPALDDALIRTLSFWKRNLAAELGQRISNEMISALFNTVIFARALEDNQRRFGAVQPNSILRAWDASPGSLASTLKSLTSELTGGNVPAYLFDDFALHQFDALEPATARSMLADFYINKFAPYTYDFSIISHHALSRIYEHYVSLLHSEPTAQLSFIPPLPDEDFDKSRGVVYTPQFIARFFARYLREHVPPHAFKRLRSFDPACGSGIFLRTLLEMQCDPVHDGVSPEMIETAFQNVTGLDIDANATQATRLSLALLHLVLLNRLPPRLDIQTVDALETLRGPDSEGAGYLAAISNPPFVAHDKLSIETRQQVAEILGGHGRGKNDLHLAFVRLSLDLLVPGGLGLFVLPHSFLLAENARGLRKLLAEQTWIRCLADLSSIRVFEDTGVYVVLLIFEKRPVVETTVSPTATILKCQDSVGHALQDLIDERRVQTADYSIYEANQSEFAESQWMILPRSESSLRRRLVSLPRLKEFANVRQGIVTGADDVFIIPDAAVPSGERGAFLPLLHDREMHVYAVPKRTARWVFYPYRKGERLAEQVLRREFPMTWRYLLKHKDRLSGRPSLARYKKEWWEPLWARPASIQNPKIVTPHLVLVPKFAIDARGKYGVSRSPIIVARQETGEDELLGYLLAVLNSAPCFWYIRTHSHRYDRGYLMLESKTLAETPIPDPANITASQLKSLLRLVDMRVKSTGSNDDVSVEKKIDAMVAELYGLSKEERLAVGMED